MFSILNMDFSDRVKIRMQALQLSSVELAQLVGVSKGSVTHWTNGTNQASGKRLIALANALECSATWLATGEGDPGDVIAKTKLPMPHQGGVTMETTLQGKESAASMVLDMLKKHAGKSLNSAAQQRIAQAVADSLAESSGEESSKVISADFSRNAVREGEISIPKYDIRASMGHGQVPAEYNEAVRNIIISESLLQEKGVTYSSPSSLAMITGWGQSMEGTINDKDPVIVDRGVNEYVGDGVYVITWAGHLFIKRLQLAGENQLELISDNPNHKDRVVQMDEVIIHAKVLLVWNAKRL
ncbi:transcriptional repressor DicA [compost metagenome]